MRDAVSRLDPGPDHLLVDALRLDCELPQQPIIHGDALSASIAAASILAKVERDRMVVDWDSIFPMYGLASNKGYSTPQHLAALRARIAERYDSLSNRLQQIAKFVLDHPNDIALETVVVIAERAGVPPSALNWSMALRKAATTWVGGVKRHCEVFCM